LDADDRKIPEIDTIELSNNILCYHMLSYV